MKKILRMLNTKANESIVELLFGEMTDLIKRGLVSKIELSDNDVLYRSLNEYLYKLNPKKYEENMYPNTQIERLKLMKDISYVIKCGKGEYMRISTSIINATDKFKEREILTLLIFGPQRKRVCNYILKNILTPIRKDMIRTTYTTERNNITSYTHPRDFDSIIMNDEAKKYLISNLNKWKKDEEWFKSHRLIYKKGILLHGKPGTGKSSIVKAISNMFGNAIIISISPNSNSSMTYDIDYIISCRNRVVGTIIVLIEDIDMIFTSREKDKNGYITNPEYLLDGGNVAQNELFQLIDGIHSTNNTIYIATTNYIDRLDPALIRPGRFDIKLEIDYFDEEKALKFVEMFGYNEDDLSKMNVTYPIQSALLQSKVMEYRTTNDD